MKDVYSDTLHIEADCGRGFKSVLIYSGSDKLYYGEKPLQDGIVKSERLF